MHKALLSSKSAEYYTPEWVLTSARTIITHWGYANFDLDPASCALAQQTVQAERWCGLDHPDPACRDGLTIPWHGLVWLNPPYGREIQQWIRKLISEYTRGNCQGALVLVPARLDTQWFRLLSHHMTGFYMFHRRLTFATPHATRAPAPFPSALVALYRHRILPPIQHTDRYTQLP